MLQHDSQMLQLALIIVLGNVCHHVTHLVATATALKMFITIIIAIEMTTIIIPNSHDNMSINSVEIRLDQLLSDNCKDW